jgi:predicted DCC family thiol-disulfide oxidoreductase YuxK
MASAEDIITRYHRIILFDGVCNFCNSSIQRVMQNDPEGRFHFASLQSEIGQQLLDYYLLPKYDFDTFLLIENGSVFSKSSAALRVARMMSWPWKLLLCSLVFPRPLRDLVYSFIAKRRYAWFGKKDACMIPTAEQRARFIG